MKNAILRIAAVFAIVAQLSGCVVYDYPPYSGMPTPYERAWNNAMGTLRDEGIEIIRADRAAGLIEGRRGGITVTTRMVAQSDGSVRVEFNAGGALSEDPGLPERISQSYDARR